MESFISRKIIKGSLTLALPLLVSSCQTTPPDELCDRFWYQAKQTGNSKEARVLFEQAIDQGRKSDNGMKLAKVLLDFGDFLLRDGDAASAKNQAVMARQSLDATRSAPAFGSAEDREREVMIARSQYLLAKAYTELGRLEEAKKEYEQALALHDRVLGDMSKKLEMMRQYISLLKKMGKTEESSELEIKQQALYTTVDDCDRLIQDSDDALGRGDIAAARRSLRIARLAAEKFGPSSNRFRDTFLHSAICEFVAGDFAKTKALLKDALDAQRHPGNRTRRDLCRENVLMGFCYELESDMVQANRLYETAALQYPGGPSATLYTVAGYLEKQHKLDLMIKCASRAYALCEALPASRNRSDTSNKLLGMIAKGLHDSGRYDEAQKRYKQMIEAATTTPIFDAYYFRDCLLRYSDNDLIREEVQGDLDFLSHLVIPKRFTGKDAFLVRAAIAQRMAADLAYQRKLKPAETKALESLDLARKTEDKNVICLSHLHLADILRDQRRYDEAEAQYKYGISLASENNTKALVFDCTHHLADMYMRQERHLEGRDKYLEAWRLLQHFNDEHLYRSTDLAIRLAEAERALSHFDKAEKWAQTAKREFSRVQGNDPNFGSVYLYTLADIAASRKDYERALQLYKDDLAYCQSHKVGKALLENAIARPMNLADKMFKRGLKQESVAVVDISVNAYVRNKAIDPHTYGRLERWILTARKEGFEAEADRWSHLLKTRKTG